MRIDETRRGPVLLLRPLGDVDLAELPALDGRVRTQLAQGARHVVIDLSAVSLLPSTAVGALIQIRQRVREAGGRLALACVSRFVRSTLATMGVDELIRCYADVETALAALPASEGTSGLRRRRRPGAGRRRPAAPRRHRVDPRPVRLPGA